MKRIEVQGVSKKFRIGFVKAQGALARLVSLFSGVEPKKVIWALKGVSLNAGAGEIVGIVGENGYAPCLVELLGRLENRLLQQIVKMYVLSIDRHIDGAF